MAIANQQFSLSKVNVQLSVALLAKVKSNYDLFNNSLYTATASLKQHNLAMIDPNAAFSNKSLPVRLNQLVIVLGGFTDICAASGAAPRELSIYSGLSHRCGNISLVHEIGHNLGLIHQDGATKTLKGDDSNIQLEWSSIMNAFGGGARYFTGGRFNSVKDEFVCQGVCNEEPFENRNSISILNSNRFLARNNYLDWYRGFEKEEFGNKMR